jgi:glycosyltransferase involved in cell wall biosynthesis
MKILVIANNCLPYSGWGRYTKAVLEEYIKKDIDFAVLTESEKTGLSRELPVILPGKSIINIIKNIFTVRRYARGHNVVHAFDGWPYAVYGYCAVLGTKKRLIINGIGTYSVAAFQSPLKGFFLRRAYRRAHKILCISNYTRDQILKGEPQANAVTVHLGLSAMPRLTTEQILENKKKFTIPDRSPVIVTVGAIKARKGQLDTAKAIALLKKDFPNILYIIIGGRDDESYAKTIESFANENDLKNNIRIVSDARDDEALAFFYEICDLFALNSNNDGSHFEGFGLVFLEAYQYGKPGVGSRNCGIEDAVSDGQTGYLTNQGDAEDIAQKIRMILGQDKTYWADRTKQFASTFSWDITAEAYLDTYR